jgi:hypothetical protein
MITSQHFTQNIQIISSIRLDNNISLCRILTSFFQIKTILLSFFE